tara:strand:- start:3522 stop:3695 length:174 start_codon:yes stop_codon:yes gene_type:complete
MHLLHLRFASEFECYSNSSNNKSQMVYKVNMVGLEKNSKKDLGEVNDNERFELLIAV